MTFKLLVGGHQQPLKGSQITIPKRSQKIAVGMFPLHVDCFFWSSTFWVNKVVSVALCRQPTLINHLSKKMPKFQATQSLLPQAGKNCDSLPATFGSKISKFPPVFPWGKRWESQMTYVAPAYFCSNLAASSKSPMWRGYHLSCVFCMCLSSPKASGEVSPKPQRKPVPTRRVAYSTATLNVLQETVDRKICVCFHTIN